MKECAKGLDLVAVGANVGVVERAKWQPHWKIEKYDENMNLYTTEEFDSNLLLNEGITEFLTLLIGGSATAFNTANARIGVGNGTTAVAATQTGLQGASKAYAAMDATYPQVSNQTVTFRATLGVGVGSYAWEEFTITNGADDTAKNLNRKVENHGTKGALDTWVISCSVTIS